MDNKPASMKTMLRYATEKEFSIAIILGPEEVEKQTLTVKDLVGRQQRDNLTFDETIAWIDELRGQSS